MQKNITKSYEKTNWIAKKTVISAGLLNKIEDKLLDLDLNLANKAELNDNQVKNNATWSSNKIARHAIEQDGVFWTEKEGNFISVDNTYEYKLKEIEIFGDTVQGFKDEVTHQQIVDSIKSTGLDNNCRLNDDGTFTVTYHVLDWNNMNDEAFIQLKPNTTYSTCIWRDNGQKAQIYAMSYENRSNPRASNGFTTGESGKVFLYPMSAQGGKLKIRVVEGEHDLSKHPYDYNLSSIEHVGELYVNSEGEPKLDEQGRKQYKINIRSVDGLNLLNLNPETWTPIPNKPDVMSEIIKVKPNTTYTYKQKKYTWRGLKQVDERGNEIKILFSAAAQNEVFTTPEDCEYIQMYCGQGNNQQPLIREMFLYEGTEDLPFTKEMFTKDYKQTILLPCQLSKIGNVKDRLFWDESKGKYIIEKKIKTTNLPTLGNINSVLTERGCKYERTTLPLETWNRTFEGIDTEGQSYWEAYHHALKKPLMLIPGTNVKSHYVNGHLLENISGKLVSITNQNNNVRVLFRDTECLDVEEMNKWVKTFEGKTVYYIVSEPELIETNITEPLYLPTYNNKTHVYHINNNNAKATIKAKFPLKTASAVANLKLENTKNSKDILEIKELNVNMVATNFDIDYRVLELEWALEDSGITNINLLNTLNIDKKNNKTLTRYEQAKIIIATHAYEYELLAKQLSRYLEKDIITQDEYDELIALMEENE